MRARATRTQKIIVYEKEKPTETKGKKCIKIIVCIYNKDKEIERDKTNMREKR